MAAGWPVPAMEEARTEFDGAAGEQGAGGAWGGLREPGSQQGKGGQNQKPFTGLGAAWLQEKGFPPTSATHNRAPACGFCSPFRGKLWEETGTRQGSCDEEAEGREAEERGGIKPGSRTRALKFNSLHQAEPDGVPLLPTEAGRGRTHRSASRRWCVRRSARCPGSPAPPPMLPAGCSAAG